MVTGSGSLRDTKACLEPVPAQVWVSSPSQPARPRLRKAPVLGSQWRLAEILGWEWEGARREGPRNPEQFWALS